MTDPEDDLTEKLKSVLDKDIVKSTRFRDITEDSSVVITFNRGVEVHIDFVYDSVTGDGISFDNVSLDTSGMSRILSTSRPEFGADDESRDILVFVYNLLSVRGRETDMYKKMKDCYITFLEKEGFL